MTDGVQVVTGESRAWLRESLVVLSARVGAIAVPRAALSVAPTCHNGLLVPLIDCVSGAEAGNPVEEVPLHVQSNAKHRRLRTTTKPNVVMGVHVEFVKGTVVIENQHAR